ncbi:phosphoglucan phosphatase LSF2, chloroplastic [Tanacetum coccineum]
MHLRLTQRQQQKLLAQPAIYNDTWQKIHVQLTKKEIIYAVRNSRIVSRRLIDIRVRFHLHVLLQCSCDMDLNTTYDTFTAIRSCGPNKKAIRGATYDFVKNYPGKGPFKSLPKDVFGNVADWERKLIQDHVRN